MAASQLDTDVLIIGAGMSGLCFAVQLQQQYPQRSFAILEKTDNLGGTWVVNTYPGCGCDVLSHFYSYSFALKPDWSQAYAQQPEIWAYFRDVARRYDVARHIRYRSKVVQARFDEMTGTWVTTIVEEQTGKTTDMRSRVVVAAVGALSIPKGCDIRGVDRFKGLLFHSAQWDHSFDWTDKQVVVIGNGCSATQFVPILAEGTSDGAANNGIPRGRAQKVTQFSRQPHWIAERPNPRWSPAFKWAMAYVPLAMRLYRFWIYVDMESDFLGFYLASGEKIRGNLTRERIEYMKRTAPEKYHEALTPKTEIGCKRKVNDTDYLTCLHNDNVELVWADPIDEITESGVRTKSGREVSADAIILANGFETQQVLYPLDIKGEKGVSLTAHWKTESNGHPEAYYGTCISGFPNFFVMMGPNTATGHLSVIYTTECQVNFSLCLLKPILQEASVFTSSADTVTVTAAAERRDNDWIKSESARLVWASGCTSWYIDPKTGRNTMLYPSWQFEYWLRSIFIPYKRDFVYKTSPKKITAAPASSSRRRTRGKSSLASTTTAAAAVASGLGVAVGVGLMLGVIKVSEVEKSIKDNLGQLRSWGVRNLQDMVNLARNAIF